MPSLCEGFGNAFLEAIYFKKPLAQHPAGQILRHQFNQEATMEPTRKKAPRLKVLLSDGTEIDLAHFWQRQPLVLVFLRHFG
jgi:hypothetical protein